MDFPLTILLVRHSITAGNLAGQYIGRTDQPLCKEGIVLAQAVSHSMPTVPRVYCSPMRRCRQTAALLYPAHTPREVADLREADFGICEGHTYAQLANNPDYRDWIASSGALPPPGGEEIEHFSKRCVTAFFGILDELSSENIMSAACVIHGGSIMAIMAALASPKRKFYDWRVANCCGFIVNADPQSRQLTLVAALHGSEQASFHHLMAAL
ncbi:MAG: histidine phosphatase family protein [Candidatus Fimivivens sp.]